MRELLELFADTEYDAVPLPLPLAFIATQSTPLVAIQEQEESDAVTTTVLELMSPPAGTVTRVGLIVNVQCRCASEQPLASTAAPGAVPIH